MRSILTGFFLFLVCNAWAESTLYKCTDKGGKVTYTDFPSATNCHQINRGGLTKMPPQKEQRVFIDGNGYDAHTAQQIIDFRANKEAEKLAAYQRRQLEAVQAMEDARAEEAERQAKKDAELLDEVNRLSKQGRAGKNKARKLLGLPPIRNNPPPPVQNVAEPNIPQQLDNCNGSGCTDRSGNLYYGNPEFNRYSTPDGKDCYMHGGQMYCN